MSQVTQGLVDEFRRAIVLNRRPAYTFNEFEQLLWAWEELQRVRASIERGVFRVLEIGEGPQSHAATSPDVLSRQSPVEADTRPDVAYWQSLIRATGCYVTWSQAREIAEAVHTRLASLAAVAASPSDTSQVVSEATAWLIESKFSGVQASWWNGLPLGGGQSFTSDPNAAIRFPRKEDAERVAMHMHMTIVTEHKWI